MSSSTHRKKMRMKELVARSGVNKSTILYYIKEGLIPKPIKASYNQHYYTEEHLTAVHLVKELQQKRYLPLSVIKTMLSRRRNDLSVNEIRTIAEMDGKLFGNLNANIEIRKLSFKQLCQRTGALPKEIQDLERMGILRPEKKGKEKIYSEDDIQFMECWRKLRELGFSSELGFDATVLAPHKEMMEALVNKETDIMIERTADRLSVEEMINMVEGGTSVINTMIGLMRKRCILDVVEIFARKLKEKKSGGG